MTQVFSCVRKISHQVVLLFKDSCLALLQGRRFPGKHFQQKRRRQKRREAPALPSANGMFEALWFASSLSANDCLTIASIPAGNECTLSKLKLNPVYEAHTHNS
jgi:hypothetical protein